MPGRRVPLAWKNLTHDRRRLLVAVCGISFAVILMFMETGFQNALFDSTVQIIRDLDADLILVNKSQYALMVTQSFSLRRIYQARGCPQVSGVYPLYVEPYRTVWKQPDSANARQKGGRPKDYPIRVLAFQPGDPVFLIPEVNERAEALREPGTALIDAKSKSIYGIPEAERMLLAQRGAELSDKAIRLIGTFRLGTDFATDGNLIMSAANFARYVSPRLPGSDPLDQVQLGIVQVEEGADPVAVEQRLRRILPDDVEVYTKSGFVDYETDFWSSSTPIGLIFLTGTMIGFLVGVIICYQIIFSSIADHMAEFATLKAMGYGNSYFVAFVLKESLYLSILSFLPGMLISLLLYQGLAQYTGLLMILNFRRAVFVFLLTVGICIVSGCLAMRKVISADPAELF